MQNTLEQRLADFASELPKRTSLAIRVVENANLAVRAYVGSVDFSDSERFGPVDMVRAIRSPGSTLKPFLYGFALEDGRIHSQSMLTDAPVSFGGYRPGNFTGGAGASLESLTEAFTCFARKGLSGKLRFFEDEALKNRYVTSESAAWVVRHILETNPSRTRHNDLFDIPEYRKIAWKTGTSYGFRDGTPLPGHYGAITAAPLLFAIFDSLPTETPGTESRRPENFREMDICWPLGVPADTLAQGLCHVRKTAWVIDGVGPPTLPDRNASPPMLGIGIHRPHYTTGGILENKTFSVCFPSSKMAEKTDYCGLVSGKKVDKSELFDVFYGNLNTAPMIAECPLCLECRLDVTKMDPMVLTMHDNGYWKVGQQVGKAWSAGKKLKKEE